MENNGLADYLRIPDEIKGDITKRHRKSNHLRKVVSYYLTRCPSPSWRGIILAVEWMGAHDVADSIRERVEPVRGMQYRECGRGRVGDGVWGKVWKGNVGVGIWGMECGGGSGGGGSGGRECGSVWGVSVGEGV